MRLLVAAIAVAVLIVAAAVAVADDWARAVLKGIGAPATPENIRFMTGWQRWEGGHTHNKATYNWLNTTRGSRWPGINSVGVRAYPDFNTGVTYTVDTLVDGYSAIVKALRKGDIYDSTLRPGVVGDLSKWVSGKRTGREDYAYKVLGVKGDKAPKAAPSSRPTGAATGDQSGRDSDPLRRRISRLKDRSMGSSLFGSRASAGRQAAMLSNPVPLANILDRLSEEAQAEIDGPTRGLQGRANGKGSKNGPYKGKVYTPGSKWNGTHITDGLDWNDGRKTAQDVMLPPGTPVGAPEDGVIIKWGSAQGGEALYFRSDSGHLYWLGHIDKRLPVGTRVKRGQALAVISSDHAAPHLHIDRKL